MVHDPVVAQAIGHTLIYTALFVPGTMVVGLFLAVAMNRQIRFISFYRTAAYATMAISTISEAIVFIWLFDPSYGVVNYFLGAFGMPAAAVHQLPVRGALRDRGHDDLGLDRVLGGDLPGRPAGGAAAPDRGGRDRRGRAPGRRSAGSPSRCSARPRCSWPSG